MLSVIYAVIRLNAVMLNVLMLSVMTPRERALVFIFFAINKLVQ